MTTLITIIIAAVSFIVGGLAGYYMFLKFIKGKYNQTIEAAKQEADVIKEKKLLEVKEKFLNKKAELEKNFPISRNNSQIIKSYSLLSNKF